MADVGGSGARDAMAAGASREGPSAEFVEIVLASYSPDLDFFAEQIQSLQQQTWLHWHCHIVDDGSPPEIVERMQACWEGDRRFTLHLFSTNVGVYRNFERGLALCHPGASVSTSAGVNPTGAINVPHPENIPRDTPAPRNIPEPAIQQTTAIALCDQDDSWHPHKLERLLAKLQDEQAVLVHSDLEAIDRDGNMLHPSCWTFEGRTPEAATLPLLSVQNVVTGCSCLFRPQLLAIALPFPDFTVGECLHDWWIALVAAATGRIATIREPLVRYRQHDRNVVGAVQRAGKVQRVMQQWRHNRFRITGKGYAAYRELTHVVAARMADHALLPIVVGSSSLHFMRLAWHSRQTHYGAEGTAMRLAALALLAGDIC